MKIPTETKSYIQLYSWFFYLVLFPFQFFPPGSPQFADLLMLVGISSILLTKWTIDNYIKSLSYFVIYTFIIGTIFFLIYNDFDFLKQPLNYIYCLCSLMYVSQVSKHSKFIKVSLYGIFCSLIIQVLIFYKLGINQEQFRVTLFFNNPNQLGLWGLSLLIFLTLLTITNSTKLKYKLPIFISLILSYFFIFLSISQAAIISSALIFILLLVFFLRTKLLHLTLFFLILMSLLFANKFNFENLIFLNNVQNRIEMEINEDDGDNGLEGRNYTRLYNFPMYLFFGAGEGKIERFNENTLEIHSTFANIIFSYGIFGLIIFMIPLFNFIRQKSLMIVLLLFAYYFFTLVHNTLRWPLFWIIPYLLYTFPFPYNKNFEKNYFINKSK